MIGNGLSIWKAAIRNQPLLGGAAPTTTIISASIDAEGWFIRVRYTGTLTAPNTNFANYPLDPDGASPKLLVAGSHPGYSQSGGQAVAATRARYFLGTKAIRRLTPSPATGATIPTKIIDETDHGDGTVTVKIALDNWVYATDYDMTLSVLADWRTGLPAETIAVTNNSTRVCSIPIFRWYEVPYRRTDNMIRVAMGVFSHHPNGMQPVAGVKFTITDGTTTKTVWATSLTTSTTYGDATRCYEIDLDGSTGTPLTNGLLRIDAEVYPWVGSMRSTDTAGTRSMATLTTDGHSTTAAMPDVVAYDPGGTRYGTRYICIDATTGTSTAASVTIATTWAAAKAGTRAANVTIAMLALYANNRTLAAANGQAASARSADGAFIGVLDGTTQPNQGFTAVTSGLTSNETWVNVIGDPDAVDGKATCIMQTSTTGSNLRASKFRFHNLAFEVGTGGWGSTNPKQWWFDRIEYRGKAGSETSTTAIITTSGTPANGFCNAYWTGTKAWKAGRTMALNGGVQAGLVRGCQTSRRIEAYVVISNTWIGHLDPNIAANAGDQNVLNWGPNLATPDVGASQDYITFNNDFRHGDNKGWDWAAIAAVDAGTSLPAVRRHVNVNNLFERVGNAGANFWQVGELNLLEMYDNIFEGNTTVGERESAFFCQPAVSSQLQWDTRRSLAYCNRVANTVHDFTGMKDDTFADGAGVANNTANGGSGYAAIRTGTYSATYGCGYEGNYDPGRYFPRFTTSIQEYFGRRSVQNYSGLLPYVDDKSILGTGAGGGNYAPGSGAPWIDMGTSANCDRDVFGSVRTVPFNAGAVEA